MQALKSRKSETMSTCRVVFSTPLLSSPMCITGGSYGGASCLLQCGYICEIFSRADMKNFNLSWGKTGKS